MADINSTTQQDAALETGFHELFASYLRRNSGESVIEFPEVPRQTEFHTESTEGGRAR